MIHKIASYLKFLIKGKTKYSLQSPFVHDFIERVLEDRETYYSFLAMDFLKRKLKQDKTILSIEDKGAGSHFSSKNLKSVKQIAKTAVSSDLKAQALFKLVNLYQPNTILELGTSLGLTTCYLANAKRNSKLTTIEGSKQIHEIAIRNFKKMGLQKINAINAGFDEVLPSIIKEFNDLDFVFFDGNHTKEATLNYYHQCKAKANPNTVFVFDDIYWSKPMTSAWNKIISDSEISLSLDLFSFGVVFFLENRAKQHLQIIHSVNLH
jgi:predicted O-methyltransferase YrrM